MNKKLLIMLMMIGSLSVITVKAGNPCNCYHEFCTKIVNETFCPFSICIDQTTYCPEVPNPADCSYHYCATTGGYLSQTTICELVFGPPGFGCGSCTTTSTITFNYNSTEWTMTGSTADIFTRYLSGQYAGVTTTYTDGNGQLQTVPNSFNLGQVFSTSLPCTGGHVGSFTLLLYKGADGFYHLITIY